MRRKLWQLINCKVDDFDQLQLFCQRLTVRWHLHAISIANLLRIRVCSLFSWTRLPYLHLNLKSARLKAIDRFWSANASTLPKTHTNWIKHEFESSWQVQNLPIKTKRSTLKKKNEMLNENISDRRSAIGHAVRPTEQETRVRNYLFYLFVESREPTTCNINQRRALIHLPVRWNFLNKFKNPQNNIF